MTPGDDVSNQPRTTCLPWMLGFLFLGFLTLILIIATGGYFMYVLVVMFAIVVVSGMHYALWGRMLDDKVAGEREEEEETRRWEQRRDDKFRER